MTDQVFPAPEGPVGLLSGSSATILTVRSPENRKAIRTLRCRTEATGRFTHRHHIRDLPPFGGDTDAEPTLLLGNDSSPSPSETLLAALGSCLSISIHAGAVARSVPIRHLAIELSGDIDFGALWGTNDPAFKTSGFETIAVVVHIDSDAPRQTLKALVDYATLWSPVGNTLHNPVHLDVSLAD